MRTIREGLKENVGFSVKDSDLPGTVPTLTSPQRRIVNSARALVTGFDWAAATWDGATGKLYFLFDSTVAAISTPGTYYAQFRGTIGAEIVGGEVPVVVRDWGP